ncbi:FlgD immunoglobulin-like domain containing protein [Roseivirga sp. BDSF3-8]|uniref:FlgD immunoglobulin-like domain containing protein n=1 Tax=Roseivirga sp. BDSF3-8 TaxID=3241598 RepID=UPI00353259B3
MRKTLLLLIGLICAVFTVHAQKKADAHVSRYMSPGDPNLNPNWNWTVNGSGHTMYYSTSGQTPTALTNVQLPFYTQGHTLNTYEKDMYPEDGWVLAYRDFGTPTSAPAIPFFVLYNKYRGIFRVMCYNAPNISANYFRMELSFWDPSKSGALFTFNDETKAFKNNYNASVIESAMGTVPVYRGWAYADFTMFGFDPGLHPDARLRMKFYQVDESQINLASTSFTLNEVVNEATPTASRITGGDIVDAVNKGHKYYKSVNKAKKALQDKIDKTSGTPWWKGPATDLITGAVGTIAPYIGGLMGLVTSFIGGKNEQKVREPMKFEGAIELQGTINSVTPSFDIDFALSPGTQMADAYRPLRTIKWGVFNLNNIPVVDEHTIYEEFYHSYWGECETEESTTHDLDKSTFNYSFNTQSGMTLTSVKVAYTYRRKAPTSYYNIATQDVSAFSYYYNGFSSPGPNGIAVELTLSINSPTRYSDDELVVYKVYPYSSNSTYQVIGDCNPYGYRLGTEQPVLAPGEFMVSPNPIKDKGAQLTFRIEKEGHYTLNILDVQGREIATLVDDNRKGGIHTVRWNGNDARGKMLRPGLYHYLLNGPDGSFSGKIVKD